jgi:transcriptional regulator with XRE-family HTH domain
MTTNPLVPDPATRALKLARGREIFRVPGLARALREAAGLSTAELVRATGGSRASIGRYERGEGRPIDVAGAGYLEILAALADHYGDRLDEPWASALATINRRPDREAAPA